MTHEPRFEAHPARSRSPRIGGRGEGDDRGFDSPGDGSPFPECRAGRVTGAQQQFWRGYMPVMLLVHHVKYGLSQANYFLTGPTIVDKSNVEQVAALVEQGYR